MRSCHSGLILLSFERAGSDIDGDSAGITSVPCGVSMCSSARMTTTAPPTVYPTFLKEEWTITVCFGRKPRAVKSVTRESSVSVRNIG